MARHQVSPPSVNATEPAPFVAAAFTLVAGLLMPMMGPHSARNGAEPTDAEHASA